MKTRPNWQCSSSEDDGRMREMERSVCVYGLNDASEMV